MTTVEALDLRCHSLRDLVCAAQSGDHDAFIELMDRYDLFLRARVGHKKFDHIEPDDILQEIRMRAFRFIHQVRDPAAFVGWLGSIAHTTVINCAKRSGRSVATDPTTLEATCIGRECSAEEVERVDTSEYLVAIVAGLRELDREALKAFYLEGHSVKTISEMFGAPEGTIKRRLYDARNRLKKALECSQAICV